MADTALFSDNPNIKELLEILQKQNMDEQTKEFISTLKYVENTEKQLAGLLSELRYVKQQLAEIKDKQNPLVKVCIQMIKSLETQINKLKRQLNALKSGIIEGAKQAVSAFKEKGAAALNSALNSFFGKINKELNTVKNRLQENINFADKSIAKIDAASAELHTAGAAIRNIGRAITGKELINRRENGRLAAVIQAPFRTYKLICGNMKNSIVTIAVKLERHRQNQQNKIPLLTQVEQNKRNMVKNPQTISTPAKTQGNVRAEI